MKIDIKDKQRVKALCHNLSSKLLIHPLFMYYCPEKAVRREYIGNYFNYFINQWADEQILLTNEANTIMLSLVNPIDFKYKFSGKGAGGMKEFKLAPNIFEHQNEIEEIFDVVVPASRTGRVMTVYADISTDFEDIQELVREAMQIAKDENFVLLYDTFSARLQPLMKNFGFKLVYNKNFLSTNFSHSVMVYNF